MNLHLFNAGDTPLTGIRGMRVKAIPADEVVHEAGAMLAGPLSLEIPPGRVTQHGSCTFAGATTLYSVFPHMHQLGVHMKITAQRAALGEVVLFDDAYDFEHQQPHRFDPLPMEAGDQILVECTYMNTTNRTVRWGDSSLDEMCFAGVGMYPDVRPGPLPCFN
jgi:hypothetical protein